MARIVIAVSVAALTLAGCGGRRDEPPAASPAPTAALPAPAATPEPVSPVGNPTVGGASMLPTRSIADNLGAAPNLSQLLAAVSTAGMTAQLAGPGPLTLFAPSNEAFGRLAPGTVDQLLKPENKPALVRLLSYHLVPGAISGQQLMQMIAAGGGTATLTTVAGQPIKATMTGNVITLTSATGNQSYIEVADVRSANGVIHVVNGVLVPVLAP